MKNFYAIVAVTTLIPCTAMSQSIFEDARGKTSLLLDKSGGFLNLSFGDGGARFGYFYDVGSRNFFGFDVRGKLQGDSSNIFSNDRLSNDAELGLTFGTRLKSTLIEQTAKYDKQMEDIAKTSITDRNRRAEAAEKLKKLREIPDPSASERKEMNSLFHEINQIDARLKPIDEQIAAIDKEKQEALGRMPYAVGALKGTLRMASYSFYDVNRPFKDQFYQDSFQGFSLEGVYNVLVPGARFGLSLGYQRDNNIGGLTSFTIKDTESIIENGVTRTVERSRSAYIGALNMVDRIPLRLDYVTWPKMFSNKLGVTFYARMDLRNSSGSFTPGIGIFLAKEGAPAAVVGGVTLMLVEGKAKAALIAGYKF